MTFDGSGANGVRFTQAPATGSPSGAACISASAPPTGTAASKAASVIHFPILIRSSLLELWLHSGCFRILAVLFLLHDKSSDKGNDVGDILLRERVLPGGHEGALAGHLPALLDHPFQIFVW